jgi:hypothetical protein
MLPQLCLTSSDGSSKMVDTYTIVGILTSCSCLSFRLAIELQVSGERNAARLARIRSAEQTVHAGEAQYTGAHRRRRRVWRQQRHLVARLEGHIYLVGRPLVSWPRSRSRWAVLVWDHGSGQGASGILPWHDGRRNRSALAWPEAAGPAGGGCVTRGGVPISISWRVRLLNFHHQNALIPFVLFFHSDPESFRSHNHTTAAIDGVRYRTSTSFFLSVPWMLVDIQKTCVYKLVKLCLMKRGGTNLSSF